MVSTPYFNGVSLKHVDTWLNEKQFKTFIKTAKREGVTPYTLTKNIILKFLEDKHEEAIAKTIVFYFFLYSMFVATLIYLL